MQDWQNAKGHFFSLDGWHQSFELHAVMMILEGLWGCVGTLLPSRCWLHEPIAPLVPSLHSLKAFNVNDTCGGGKNVLS